jgi:hypothetical protein
LVELTELRLPREGFIGLAEVLLPGSQVEVLYADIDETELGRLVARLPEWGFDELRIVSSRFQAPIDWRAPPMQRAAVMTDPLAITVRAAVAMTNWRHFDDGGRFLLCSLDLSALRLTEFPPGATLRGSPFLESVVLPPGLRVLPTQFLFECWRLSRVETAGCVALETIERRAFAGCTSLKAFSVPSTVRKVDRHAFVDAGITCLDF